VKDTPKNLLEASKVLSGKFPGKINPKKSSSDKKSDQK